MEKYVVAVASAALLLFGVMTLWLPPVRSALFLYPLATIASQVNFSFGIKM
jgi:hypothetical protein